MFECSLSSIFTHFNLFFLLYSHTLNNLNSSVSGTGDNVCVFLAEKKMVGLVNPLFFVDYGGYSKIGWVWKNNFSYLNILSG